MKEEYNYQEIMEKVNKVANLLDIIMYNDIKGHVSEERKMVGELADMYIFYSLNKDKFTQDEQNKIENEIGNKANGWIPFYLYHNHGCTKNSEELFNSLMRKHYSD